MEKNRKECMVVIDGARKGQFKEPRGPVRPMLLDSGLFVGANPEQSDGYVGCMRALVLNGVPIDLQGEAVKTDSRTGEKYGVYGIGLGCEGKLGFIGTWCQKYPRGTCPPGPPPYAGPDQLKKIC